MSAIELRANARTCSWVAWVATLSTLGSLAACEKLPGEARDSRAIAQPLAAGETEFAPSPQWLAIAYPSLGEFGADGSISIEVTDLRKISSAIVSVSALVSTELGAISTSSLATARLDPGGQATLRIPISSLQLPAARLAVAGQILLDTQATYDDGESWATNAPALYFEPDLGTVALYDEDGRQNVLVAARSPMTYARWRN